MKDTSISNLLNAYSLPTDEAMAMEKRRFEFFIGVVINAWKRQRYWRDPAFKNRGQDIKK